MRGRNLKNNSQNIRAIKTFVLINNTDNKIKNVFLNFDMSTFAFGFIPSILRKRYETAIFILIAQILNFIMIRFSFSILTNFVVTGIAAVITAKEYINYLIDEEDFIPYSMWEDGYYKDEAIKKQLILSGKRSKRIIIISMIFIIITSIFSMIYAYNDLFKKEVLSHSDEITISNYAIITVKEEKIENVLMLNTNINNELEGIIYPENIQIELDNKVDELNNLIDINKKEVLKKAFKNNFDIEIQDFVVTTKNDIKDDIDFYKNMFSSLLDISEIDIEDKIKDIEVKYSYNEALSARKFYDNFKGKNVYISDLKYETVLLGDIVAVEILEYLDLLDKENHEFITVDKSILQNNEFVKSINEKFDEYLQNKNKQILPPLSNNGETGGSTPTPPSNNGGTDEMTSQQSNNNL